MDDKAPPSDALLREAAEALFRLGRLFSRIGVPAGGRHAARAVELSRILVVQAVEALQTHPGQEVTVGMIAQHLVVEASTASRLASEAIDDGYLVRSGSPIDSRRVQLHLTDAGRLLADDARTYQVDVFRQVTQDWTEAERSEFARLFVQFAASVADVVQAQSRLPTDRNDQPRT